MGTFTVRWVVGDFVPFPLFFFLTVHAVFVKCLQLFWAFGWCLVYVIAPCRFARVSPHFVHAYTSNFSYRSYNASHLKDLLVSACVLIMTF